jgi:hypothetical protein
MYNRTLRVHLIDTPGFENSKRSDVQVLQDIAHWLSKSFKAGTRLSGVIFMHPISDLRRITGSTTRNLRMFKKLCGEQAYQSIVLATSMWSKVTIEEGERREGILIETDEYWGLMCKNGSKVFRYADTRESALDLIKYILNLHIKVTLDIQDEMVNKGHDFNETSAAHELNADIIGERKKHLARLDAIHEQMQEAIKEAIKEHDEDFLNQFKKKIDPLQDKISEEAEEQEKLSHTLKEVPVDKRKEEEFRAFKEQMKKEREQERQRYDSERREYLASIARQEEVIRELRMPDDVLVSTDETFNLPKVAHSHPDQKELESKAEKEGLLSETLGTLSSSSSAEPVEPLIISPPRKYHLLTMPQRLYWRALWLLRPRVKIGYRRLEWICDCGTPLYGDFKGEPKEIDKLGMDLQASGFVIPKQSTPRAQAVPVSSGQQNTALSSVAQAFLKSNAPQAAPASSANPTASSVAGGIANPTPEFIVAAPAMSMPFAGIPKYLALCVNINKFKKTLSEIHISSINEDIPTFRKFKERYEECRGSRAKALRGWLIKPVDIKFIQFAVERSQRAYAILEPPDCTLCAHKDNQDTLIKSRQYEPHRYTTALVHPPIPSDAFFHLWECPEEVPETQAKWINRLPKKLHQSLEEVRQKQQPGDDTLIVGWGILIVEGLNKLAVSLLTLLVIVLSGAISICYTVWAKDTSSGFAIGAYIVAVLVALTTALYYQWEKG